MFRILGVSPGQEEGPLVEGIEVARAYGVRGTPTTVFIDADGQIVGITNTSDPDDPELETLAASIAVQGGILVNE